MNVPFTVMLGAEKPWAAAALFLCILSHQGGLHPGPLLLRTAAVTSSDWHCQQRGIRTLTAVFAFPEYTPFSSMTSCKNKNSAHFNPVSSFLVWFNLPFWSSQFLENPLTSTPTLSRLFCFTFLQRSWAYNRIPKGFTWYLRIHGLWFLNCLS